MALISSPLVNSYGQILRMKKFKSRRSALADEKTENKVQFQE
jgi:hypothetical protein